MQNNENEKVAQEKNDNTINEEVSTIDYERINTHIDARIEKEMGKFVKSFIENNRENTNVPQESVTEESEKERELKEWRI